MKFSCPKCEQNLEVGEDLAGSTFPCPSCGENIHLEAEADSISEDYLDFNCAHCDGKIRSTKEMEGSEVDCPHCQEPTILQVDEETEDEYDPYKNEEESNSVEETLAQKKKKKEKRIIPNHAFGHRQIIGLVGGIILFIGVFLPIAKIPILGTVNLFMGGVGDGIFIFFFAIISLLATMFKKEGLQMIMGLLSLGVLTVTFGNFLNAMSIMRESQSDLTQIGSNLISLEWGWALLVVSCGMLIIPAFMKAKPTDGGEEFFVLSKTWRISAISISSIYGLLIIASMFVGVFDFAKLQIGGNDSIQEAKKEKGWEYTSSISPIDDSETHILSLAANERINVGIFGGNATLVIRHKEGKTRVYINMDSYLGSDSKSVILRLDDRNPITMDWGLSSDSKAIFYPKNDKVFILEMMKAKRLVIRLQPYSESTITSVFNLTGLEEALKPMASDLNLGEY